MLQETLQPKHNLSKLSCEQVLERLDEALFLEMLYPKIHIIAMKMLART